MEQLFPSPPKVVCIGGGTGLSVLLRGLKKFTLDITAIVTVADDGGSSGKLRNDLQIPAPGDIRNVLVALADTEPLLQSVLQYRFQNGEGLAGHTLGNLMIAAMKEITGDFTLAVQEMSRVLAVRGRVLPACRENVVLCAEMEDGMVVRGESQIPKYGKKIRRVFLDPPSVTPLQEAIEAIEVADAVVIGPGSLYTSILPNLLVKDILLAMKETSAPKIYVCNVMTQVGETDFYPASDHIQAIHNHTGNLIDFTIINNEIPPVYIKEKYESNNQSMVIPDVENIQRMGVQTISDNLLSYQNYVRHDADRVSRHILRLIHEHIKCKRIL